MANPRIIKGGLGKARQMLFGEARLSELLSHGGDKALPLMLPRANLSSDFINQQAERVARQMAGEHVVSGKPKETFNLAGRSKKESQRVKGLNYKLSPTGTVAQEVPYTPRRGDLKVAIPGDQTVSNKILDEVNGFPIDSVQEGGAYYGLGQRHLADPEFWKSNEEPAKRMQSKVDRVAELYEPDRVIGSHLAMGPMSNNFAMHLADANLRAVDWSKAQPNKINIFDSIIAYGYKDPKTKEMVKFPNWPGLADREGALAAMKEDANLRKWFNDRMKTPKVTKPLGLPNGLDIQYAITEPRLRDMEINMTGLMTGELQPGALVEAAGAPHNTYSHRILGKAGGPQEVLTPFVIDFPDAAQHIASTKKPADFTGTIQKVFPHQLVDDQYLNQYGEYRDRIKELTGQKKGGAVDIDAADARLAQAIQARMAKGGAVDIEAADARLEAAINARMAGGGGAFKKIEFMAGGGKLKALGDIAKKFLADAPQAEALKLAQQRAALPKTKHGLGLPADNTPQQRAKAMGGKDKVHFSRHGGDYTTLDSGKFAIAPFDAVGTHVGTPEAAMERYQNTVGYKVNNPNYANDELKGVTYPVTILGDRPMMNQKGLPFGEDELNAFLRQQGGHNWSDTQGGKMTYQDMNAKLRKKLFEEQGYTSIPYYNEVEGKGSISYIVPPDNIRSRNAAFDPFRRDAATAAAMGVLAPDLMAEEKKKARGGLLHMADAGRVFKGVKSIGKRFMADPAESSVASARRGERTADQIGGLNIVKETGGNFLTGRTAKDLSPLRRRVTTEAAQNGRYTPEQAVRMAADPRTKANDALNNWIDSNLTNYVEKQMGTANDPVRLMFDKRAQEIDAKYAKDIAKSDRIAQKATKELDPRKQANLMREAERIKAEANIERQIAVNHISHKPSLLEEYSRTAENVKKQRMEAGFSEEGVGQSAIAKAWERASDEAIATHRAGDIQGMPEKYAKLTEAENKLRAARENLDYKFANHINDAGINELGMSPRKVDSLIRLTSLDEKAKMVGDTEYLKASAEYQSLQSPMMDNYMGLKSQNPWIEKVAPETQVYAPFTGDLGFDHIMDVLREDLTTGRIRPDQLSKVNMEQAVRRTSEYDQELAAKMNASRAAAREGLPTYREYPEGYKWIELNKPGAFAQESEAMGHSVRGYEPPKGHPDWTEASGNAGSSSYGHGGWEAIKSGKAKVYSLVDSKGAPHATVEVRNQKEILNSRQIPDDVMEQLKEEGKRIGNQKADAAGYSLYGDERFIEERTAIDNLKSDWVYSNPVNKNSISQIKGKGNRAPNEEYLPYVQDFVKGEQWSDIGDLQHTGLRDLQRTPKLDEYLKQKGVEVPRYLDEGEYQKYESDFLMDQLYPKNDPQYLPPQTPEGMARGGLLHMADAGRVGRGLAQFSKRLLQDAPPPALKIKPPSDNVANVRQANFQYPKTIGNQTVAIEKLSGGVRMSDPKEVKRVKALADQMSGPEGYISRIVVDHNDNVIEGQHRLEALRQLGVKDVPVFKIEDLADTMPVSKMEQAMREVGGIHSDHVNQLMQHALDDISEGGIEGARGLDYGQFQKHYDAALDAVLGMRPVLPAAESDANLAKMLESSKVKERLYHGTDKDFSEFKFNPKKSMGTWLTNRPKLASAYSEVSARGGDNSVVYPLYAQIKNPASEKDFMDARDIAQAQSETGGWHDHDIRHKQLLLDKGFDGVQLQDGTYIVFEPNKIKSATGNRGTYDTSNPDISKAEGGPAFKKLQFMDDGGIASPEENITSDQKPNRFSRVASEMYDEYKQSLANDYERLKASAVARAQFAKIAAAQFAGNSLDFASFATPLVNSDALLSAFPMARAAKIGLTGSPSTGRRTSVLSDEKTPYSLADYTNDINGNPIGGSEDIIKRAQKAGLLYGGTRMMYDAQEPDPSKEMLTMTPKEYEKWLNSEGRNRIDFGEQITTGRFSPVAEIGASILGGGLGSKLANTGKKFKKGFDRGYARAMSRHAPPFLRELENAPSKKRGGLTQLKAR